MSTTLDRPPPEAAGVRELEELWLAPAVEPARHARRDDVYPWLRRAVVAGWAIFLVAVIALAPAGDPSAAVPIWAELTLTAFWGSLVCAAMLGWLGRGGAALATSAAAGAFGVVVGYACRATEHHTGGWWLVEAGACAGLALLSLGALAARRGPSSAT
jgi:peptidoglycan/LPS O-acetylase OafA/YrhL